MAERRQYYQKIFGNFRTEASFVPRFNNGFFSRMANQSQKTM